LGGSFVYDQYDPVTEQYRQQKIETEQYFRQGSLDSLQQLLTSLTRGLINRGPLDFTSYIKDKTGYDIDILEDLRKRVAAIIAQNEISSQKEFNDIGAMLHHLHETSPNEEEVKKLKSLLADYSKQENESASKRKNDHSEVISDVEEGGVKKVTPGISTGPKPNHFEEQKAISPDGKRRLRVVQSSDGKQASTYVTIEFPTANGAVYGISSICPDVKAWWKDNFTIIIETKKEYTAYAQHREVRSFDDVISIEYVEG